MEKELESWYKLHQFYRSSEYLTNELAGYLKVSSRTIQRWLRGQAHPSKEMLALIKKYLSKKAEEISSRQAE